eukprot:TRINITY_DN2775_c0_g1_i1.p1 TRINITY_DN2775_c0_g1~~TRINITY_DN2775_c0_g1_i1.p1  ORF type:complete len:301 (-),score=59.88 TRINITY_DN2775_c0_g1_i1:48-950(-)
MSLFEVAKRSEGAHKDGIWGVAWKKDKILSGSIDGSVKMWNSNNDSFVEEENHFPKHRLGVISVAIDKTCDRGASSSLDGNIVVGDLNNKGTKLQTINCGPGDVWHISFNPEGTHIASGSQSGNINIWGVESGKSEQTIATQGKFVLSVQYSYDGQFIASGAADGVGQVYDVVSGKRLHTLTGHALGIRSMSFSRDSSLLLTSSDDQSILLHDLRAGASMVAQFQGHQGWVLNVAFSPDQKLFASSSADKKVKIWDITTRQTKHTFSEHNDLVWGLAWNDSGERLVSCSDDKSLIFYKIQ